MAVDLVLNRALESVQQIAAPSPPWREIFEASCELLGAFGGGFVALEPNRRLIELQEFGADPAAARDYAAHFHKHDVFLVGRQGPRPPGTWMDTHTFISADQQRKSSYYHDFMARHRMVQIQSLVIEEGPGYAAALSFQRERINHQAADLVRSERLQRFSLAVREAVARRRDATLAWYSSVEQAFASFEEALLVLDGAGELVHQSVAAQALLASNPVLRLRQGRLWHRSQRIQDLLGQCIARAAREPKPVRVQIPGLDGEMVTLELVRTDRGARLEQTPLIMARLKHRQPTSADSVHALAATLDLTDAEARVLAHLVKGLTPAAIAVAHGRSIHTVRKQIDTIKGKAGCARQLELVRMALGD